MTSDEVIRVLRVIARLNVGGPALHVSYLSKELDRRGYQTRLVAGSVGPGEGSMEYVARDLGIEPYSLQGLRRDISPVADIAAIAQLRRLIAEYRPHILHTHTAKAGAVGRIAAMLAGSDRPLVVVHTFHGHVLRGYFGPAQTQVFKLLEQVLARHTDALIAVSPQVRAELAELGVADAGKIAVIRLGLDLEQRVGVRPGERERLRAELGVPPERFVVGWLGRMTEIKRVDDLLRGFALLRARGADAELILVGDGPLRDRLEAVATDLGILDRTRFVGFRADVAGLYATFDAVALTSANEGTPVTLIEALAAGRPVVSTDVGGVGDVVREGTSGFLVPTGGVEAIADRLETLAREPELRARLGEQGRADVTRRYSVPRLADDVDRLYRALLQQRDPAERRVITGIDRPLVPALPRPPSGHRAVRKTARLRVILLSQYFPPEIGATQSRMQAFAEHLAQAGHKVTVICEFPNHPHGVIPERYRGRIVQDDRSNSYRVLRVWVHASAVKTQLTRVQFYLSYMTMATCVAPLAGRADVVVATSPPLFTGLAGAAIARLNGAPLVLDVRDLWPAAAVSLAQISGGLAVGVSERLERFLYGEATAVTTVTRPFCHHIDGLRPDGPRSVLIPNGTLDLFFESGSNGSARGSLGVGEDAFLVTFAGTHGIAQGLPAVLDSAPLLNGSVHLAFVGDGPMKDQLVADARKRNLGNVSFHEQVPLEEMPAILAASDVLLVPLSAHPTFAQFVPSKMIDSMASGRCVLLSAAGESARILQKAGAGLAIPPENPTALAEALSWLENNRDEAREMGERGREFARKRMRSIQSERLEQVLLDVTGKR